MTPSVVILVIDGIGILVDELKRDPPVATHRHGPRSPAVAAELMKFQPGECHVSWRGRSGLPTQNQTQPLSVFSPGCRPWNRMRITPPTPCAGLPGRN